MINTIKLEGKKMFAVLDSSNTVIDCWAAYTLEEAQTDNPNKNIIEVTAETSPFTIGKKYNIKK
jgi:hypothetical protein